MTSIKDYNRSLQEKVDVENRYINLDILEKTGNKDWYVFSPKFSDDNRRALSIHI